MQAEKFAAVEKLSTVCNRYTERAVLVLGLTMTAVVIAQVFSRYILNNSLFWSEELARYLLIWLSFLGASVAYRRRMHPGIDAAYRHFSPEAKRAARCFAYLAALLFFIVMIWYGSQFAFFVRLQTTPALALPKWLIFAVVPISGALMALHAIAFLCGESRRGNKQP